MKIGKVLTIIVLSGAGGIALAWWWLFRPVGQPAVVTGSSAAERSKPEIPPTIAIQHEAFTERQFPSQVTIKVNDQEYVAEYTGSFVRTSKLLFLSVDLYTVASYVVSPTTGQADAILNGLLVDGERKVYLIQFLKTLPGASLLKAINDEINLTFTDVDVTRLRPNIDSFANQFANGASRGELVYAAWLPGGLLYSSYNNRDRLNLIAEDMPLARAIWRIWAGPNVPERLELVERIAAKPE